ncbi:hypothetical protein JK232_21215, partial [Nissabacter archeti]|nr:hypothetical protein [Nissabacter archeti]
GSYIRIDEDGIESATMGDYVTKAGYYDRKKKARQVVEMRELPAAIKNATVSDGKYNEHFCLFDKSTSMQCNDFAYGISSESNEIKEGVTDMEGKTTALHSELPESITLEYLFQTKIGLR